MHLLRASLEFKEGEVRGMERDGLMALPLTVARDGEVMCAKAVLDVRQRQGCVSQEVVLGAAD